jgi:mannosylglucosylglycerate synthase
MKIALIHYSAPPIIGGVESVLASQADIFIRNGHQVRVLAGRAVAWDDKIQLINIPLLDSRDERILAIKARLDQGNLSAAFEDIVLEIQAAIENNLKGYDVLIAHNVASLHKNLPLTAALFNLAHNNANGMRIILWHHDFAWTAAQYKDELHPGYPWDLVRQAWPGVIQVTVSETRRKELVTLTGINPSEVEVIPAGIDQAELLALPEEIKILTSQLGLDSANPLLLAPVRITRRKNLELGLQILAPLREKLPNAQLVITGPTGAHNPSNQHYLQELQAYRNHLGLEGAVHFLAERYPEGLTYNNITAFFRFADGLLLTSLEEGFGIPIIEAGLSRLIIFCTDLAPLKALGLDYANYFSPEDSPDLIARRIFDRFQSDPVYRLRASVRSTYTWEAIYHNKIKALFSTRRVSHRKEYAS